MTSWLGPNSYSYTIDFTPHPDVKHYEKADKVVYYQANPLANWGPASKARNVKAAPVPKAAVNAVEKRKNEDEDAEQKDGNVKKAKVDGVEAGGNEEEGRNA